MEAQGIEYPGLLLVWVATCGNDEQRMLYGNGVVYNRHCVARYDSSNLYAFRIRLSD